MKEKSRTQMGTAAVEFAVLLPLLIVLVLGIIEFGALYYNKAMITNASRVGARIGIVKTDDPWSVTKTKIENTIDNYLIDQLSGKFVLVSLGSPNLTTTKTISPDPPTGNYSPGGTLTVAVTYHYTFLVIPNFIASIVGPIDITGQTVMRFE